MFLIQQKLEQNITVHQFHLVNHNFEWAMEAQKPISFLKVITLQTSTYSPFISNIRPDNIQDMANPT